MFFFMMWLNIKAKLQYGRTFIYEAISQFLAYYLFDFLAIWILLNKFNNIGGWSFFEILFLQALAYFIRAVAASLVWDGMYQMGSYVRDGTLDRFLVAPVNSFFYIIGRNFTVWIVSHIAIGAAAMVIMASFLDIQWTFRSVLYLIIGMLAGVLVYGALIIIGGAVSFWFVKSEWFFMILLDTLPLINYPISIYPKLLRSVLTFIIPIALMNYYSAAHILGKLNINLMVMLVILGVSIILVWLAYRFWWFGTKYYQGTGS